MNVNDIYLFSHTFNNDVVCSQTVKQALNNKHVQHCSRTLLANSCSWASFTQRLVLNILSPACQLYDLKLLIAILMLGKSHNFNYVKEVISLYLFSQPIRSVFRCSRTTSGSWWPQWAHTLLCAGLLWLSWVRFRRCTCTVYVTMFSNMVVNKCLAILRAHLRFWNGSSTSPFAQSASDDH